MKWQVKQGLRKMEGHIYHFDLEMVLLEEYSKRKTNASLQ